MVSFSINTKYSYITKCLKDYRIGEEAAKNIEDSLWKQFQALPVAFQGFFDNVTYIKTNMDKIFDSYFYIPECLIF